MYNKGEILEFTKDITGVCQVARGDKMVYIGKSQAKILAGASKDWVVCLLYNAPVKTTLALLPSLNSY